MMYLVTFENTGLIASILLTKACTICHIFNFRIAECRSTRAISSITTESLTARFTTTRCAARYARAATSRSRAAASPPCSASSTRSTLFVTTASSSLTRGPSRSRPARRTATTASSSSSTEPPDSTRPPSQVLSSRPATRPS